MLHVAKALPRQAAKHLQEIGQGQLRVKVELVVPQRARTL
jgi:hypothetical protein